MKKLTIALVAILTLSTFTLVGCDSKTETVDNAKEKTSSASTTTKTTEFNIENAKSVLEAEGYTVTTTKDDAPTNKVEITTAVKGADINAVTIYNCGTKEMAQTMKDTTLSMKDTYKGLGMDIENFDAIVTGTWFIYGPKTLVAKIV
jgi:uncharacterized lipoprotein NlpE involved in copper resistance